MVAGEFDLLSSDLFKHHYENGPRDAHLERSYLRAKAFARFWRLTPDDVLQFTPKFRHAHTDGIILRDIAAQSAFSVHYNLVGGTIASLVPKRPDLQPATYMMTEAGHGCDARNLETVAILQSDGSFILETPTPAARKLMLPSAPFAGIPRIALVLARLMVEGEDRGTRQFIVPLNDGRQMYRGIKAWGLPAPGAGRLLDFVLTSFDHVHLPSTAILGDLARPSNMRDQYLTAVDRLSTGTLTVSLWTIPFLKGAAFTVGKYSQRRTVQEGLHGKRVPIISYRTQQLPIAHTLAEVAVLDPFADWVIEQRGSPSISPGLKHALSIILKVVFVQHGSESLKQLNERSGSRGLFPTNGLMEMETYVRASTSAEGEILVHSIRSATELLFGRFRIPDAKTSDSLLGRHEAGAKGHRTPEYNSLVLPRCRPMLLAIGQRMAYEAAVDAGVDPNFLALYEAGAVRNDSSWYVEQLRLSRASQYDMECQACDSVMSQLDRHLDELGIEPYCTAPMLSPARWETFINTCPIYTEDAVPSLDYGGSRESRL
ncbi:acyl-CoA oxidase [Aspergillus neoniger CBS 115656]|uniref:Acyl-CoA oxidase n=1 Tax=Aspergillus neoniger (strain CBS 115656) TaxID=1448310 RepID=A0A318YSV6_ASPNB|nr:acyl-CoA oxidase [Aspergillus neoniger CBS 115656]PYH37404.1 acyl-CoA oxidase [Aspergillus neoniger CBS 115656]